MSDGNDIVGVLLAGGLSRRMGGGDKNLLTLDGQPILKRSIDRVKPQVQTLILNANGDAARFSDFQLPVIADVIAGYAGPLAGILTGLEWASVHRPTCRWVATFPTDAPFLPLVLVKRLSDAIDAEGTDMACAKSKGRTHPPIALWPVRLKDDLRQAMIDEDMRKIDLWTARYKVSHVVFEDTGIDPFFNINKPENLARAEHYLRETTARAES